MHKWLNSLILFFTLACIYYLTFFSSDVYVANSKNQNDSTTQYLAHQALASTEKKPVRIRIPSIGVDASVRPVGLTEQNTMESPEGPKETAWFELGVSPGQIGSSVVAGHKGWKTGSAVFDDLDKTKIGDEVYVEDENGNILTFVVREMRTYDALEMVPEVWSRNDAAYLNLITCSGKWSITNGNFPKRLVVFTELVS